MFISIIHTTRAIYVTVSMVQARCMEQLHNTEGSGDTLLPSLKILSKRKLRRFTTPSQKCFYFLYFSTVGLPLDGERERYGHHCHSQPSQRGGFGSKMQRLSMDISHREQAIGSHSGIPNDPLMSHRKYSTSPANTQTSQTGYEDSLNQFKQQQQQDIVLRKRR